VFVGNQYDIPAKEHMIRQWVSFALQHRFLLLGPKHHFRPPNLILQEYWDITLNEFDQSSPFSAEV